MVMAGKEGEKGGRREKGGGGREGGDSTCNGYAHC